MGAMLTIMQARDACLAASAIERRWVPVSDFMQALQYSRSKHCKVLCRHFDAKENRSRMVKPHHQGRNRRNDESRASLEIHRMRRDDRVSGRLWWGRHRAACLCYAGK